MFLNFLLYVEKFKDSDLVQFFEYGTKLKIPSEITYHTYLYPLN